MFEITQGKGFRMTFANGYGISVQWGYGNYCESRDKEIDWNKFKEEQARLGKEGSATAEIAVLNPSGVLCGEDLGIFDGDNVEGWCTPERVLEVMNKIAKLP